MAESQTFPTFTLACLFIIQMKLSFICGITLSDVRCRNETQLTDCPFCINIGYDKSIGPISDLPLNISIHSHIYDIVNVNDNEKTITLTMKLSVYWIESRLKLNLNSSAWLFNHTLENVAGIHMKWFEYLWKPTLHIVNIKKFKNRNILKKENTVYLHENKMVSYHLPVELVLNCPLFDFSFYPFDKQICDILIGSYEYHSGINVYRGDVLYDSSHQRKLLYHVSSVASLSFEEGLRNMTYFYYTSIGEIKEMEYQFSYFATRIKLNRRLLPHLYMTHLPSFLLVLSSWVGFLIDPSSAPGRITLSVTLLLTLINMW